MQKTRLATAIALSLGGAVTAEAARTITITQMDFNGLYAATGTLNDSATGVMNSIDPFFYNPWTATQQAWFDPATGTQTWSGTGTPSNTADAFGNFTYTFSVTGHQVAVGTFFDWSGNNNIPVLTIFDCDIVGPLPLGCTGNTLPMATPPFPGQQPGFNGSSNNASKPVANNDSAATPPMTLRVIDLVANDSDYEDDGLAAPGAPGTVTLDLTCLAAGSSVTDNGDGTVDYDPDPALVDTDTDCFQYTLTDSGGAVSDLATVNVTIAVNNIPVANDVGFNAVEDTALMINIGDPPDSGAGVISTDGDGDPMTFDIVDANSANGGTITKDVTNTVLTYTPAPNFFGTDTFNFTVKDAYDSSTPATMTMTVAGTDDPLTCTGVTLATPGDTALSINGNTELAEAGCTDIDGDTLTLVSVTQPVKAGSMLTDDGAGTLTYTPPTGFAGKDSFDFTATDGTSQVTATANVVVGLLDNFSMLDGGGRVFGGTNDVVIDWDGVSTNTQSPAGPDNIESDTGFDQFISIASSGPQPFYGDPWVAHHIRVYTAEGTYKFDSTCSAAEYDAGITDCNGPFDSSQTERFIEMTVGPGQVGVHILFDWSGNADIDVVNVWNQGDVWADPTGQGDQLNDLWTGAAGTPPDPLTTWELVSTDHNGDGIIGSPMVDGPFRGFYANFNKGPGGAGTRVIREETAPDSGLDDDFLGMLGNWLLLGIPGLLLFLRRKRH